MKTLTVREMRAALPRLEELVAKEGEILVTRRLPSHADLRARMCRLSVPSEVLVRADRDLR